MARAPPFITDCTAHRAYIGQSTKTHAFSNGQAPTVRYRRAATRGAYSTIPQRAERWGMRLRRRSISPRNELRDVSGANEIALMTRAIYSLLQKTITGYEWRSDFCRGRFFVGCFRCFFFFLSLLFLLSLLPSLPDRARS